jgi:hypothetical protein
VVGRFFQPGYGLPVYRTTRPKILLFVFQRRAITVWNTGRYSRAPLKNKKENVYGRCILSTGNYYVVEIAKGKFAFPVNAVLMVFA